MSTETRQGAPSNAELAERTARIEEKVDHISNAVDRIEGDLVEKQDELAEDIEENETRVNRFWAIYRFALYTIPIVVGSGGAVSYWMLF